MLINNQLTDKNLTNVEYSSVLYYLNVYRIYFPKYHNNIKILMDVKKNQSDKYITIYFNIEINQQMCETIAHSYFNNWTKLFLFQRAMLIETREQADLGCLETF